MKKQLILSAALALAASGCTLLQPQPTPPPGGQCSTLTPAPSLPQAQPIPAHSVPPSPPSSQFIIASTCEATKTYVATGVDLQAGSFTFLFKGGPSTRTEAFAKLNASGAPVTIYAAPMMVKTGAEETTFDPCATSGDAPPPPPGIGDDPRDPPVPPGIAALAWCTANALATVKQ